MDRPAGKWALALDLETDAKEPLFVRIARAIVRDIQRGRLAPGAALPGSRALAEAISVHRNTVLAAYAELSAEGWIRTTEAKGTYVAKDLPEVRPKRFAPRASPRDRVPQRPGFELREIPASFDFARVPKGGFSLTGGIPDVRLSPTAALARAYRRALKHQGRTLLSYAPPEGEPHLRRALAQMLAATRGLATSEDDVLVTRGSQMSLFLLARALLQPGDAIAVEALGYPPAWRAFEQAGASLAPIPVDAEGLDVAALEQRIAQGRVRAVYLTPHHQYPTTVTLSPARRLRLLELCARERIAIIEDDYDHEFHYAGRPVLPLASADRAGVVAYVGTLAKLLAPGLRIGYVVAPRPLLEQLIRLRFQIDRQGDHAIERAVAELIDDGELQRHAWRARRIYQARRDFFAQALRSALGGAIDFELPRGGMSLWARLDPSLDPSALCAEAEARGVYFHPGARYAVDGKPRPYVRLGYAAHDEEELGEAVRRLAEAALRCRPGTPRTPGRAAPSRGRGRSAGSAPSP